MTRQPRRWPRSRNPLLPKGAQIAVLYGDPDKAEPFVFPLKYPAGYKVAAHMHPNDYDVTVLSGTMYMGMGDKFDPARGEGLNPAGTCIFQRTCTITSGATRTRQSS